MPADSPHASITRAACGRRGSGRIGWVAWLSAFTIGAMAAGQPSQPSPAPEPGKPVEVTVEQAEKQRARLNKIAFAAFDRKDWAAAEAALRELIPYDADNFVPWYNLACALAMQGKADEAMQMLDQSIARGFSDRLQLERDEQLAAVRTTERYKALLATWDQLLDRRGQSNLEFARKVFTTRETAARYTAERDESLRLSYLSAFDPTLFGEAKSQLTLLSDWWNREVIGKVGPTNKPRPASLESAAVPWVTVVLPTRPDYARWAQGRFGEAWERIGGQYSHDNKLLVAMDLGATLRHEYWHVLHWRDQDQRGQRHPIWIMEGLCSLVEDVASTSPGAAFKPIPSWRTNQARRLATAAGLMPWTTLFALDPKRFSQTRPLAQYAQSRAIFLFLHERGQLGAWYAAYVGGFDEDPTGGHAFVEVFGKPIKEIEREFRLWLRDLPQVTDTIGNAAANLPFDVGPGSGDGPTVDAPPDLSFTRSNTRALGGPDGLKHQDVITAINGTPIRDLNDLARVLGELDAGTQVTVAYRRKDKHGTARITLVPPR